MPAASPCRLGICGSVAVPSTSSTGGLLRGRRHGNNAPAASGDGRRSRNPSANTSGSEDGEHDTASVAFPEEIKDLDWGSWERHSPSSSSLEGELVIPLRGAPRYTRAELETRYVTAEDQLKRKPSEEGTPLKRKPQLKENGRKWDKQKGKAIRTDLKKERKEKIRKRKNKSYPRTSLQILAG